MLSSLFLLGVLLFYCVVTLTSSTVSDPTWAILCHTVIDTVSAGITMEAVRRVADAVAGGLSSNM